MTDKKTLEELRKTHPKAFARWTEEEDKGLLEEYKRYLGNEGTDFENFLLGMGFMFGRKPNGIRGRLAKYFPNIAGWDYEAQAKRDAERKSAKENEECVEQNLNTDKVVEEKITLDISGNPEALLAYKIMEETGENLFLTGEAGTGKSTLLQYFRKTTKKNVVVLAPTGVAALNVEGQTIHSFCGFGPDITVQKVKKLGLLAPKFKLMQKLQTVIIDEISMVRADLLDCVEKFFRLNGPVPSLPFGGVQMVFIGDLYQLPPVEKGFVSGGGLLKLYNSAYFFDSYAFRNTKFNFIELKTIYRQKDEKFIEILNAIRNNLASTEHLLALNERSDYGDEEFDVENLAIYLTPINSRAKEVNNYFLQKLPSEKKVFQGWAMGSFENRELPTDLNLELKVGAQVMMLTNDARKRWVNGTMGKVVRVELLEKDAMSQEITEQVVVELENGERVGVTPYTWEMFQFTLDKKTQKINTKNTGSFTQYPFKLAWAVTIHKAQGKTFDRVFIDLSSGTFTHGQLYVALSRCRTLEGLQLKRPVEQKDIILDNRVVDFLNCYRVKSEK